VGFQLRRFFSGKAMISAIMALHRASGIVHMYDSPDDFKLWSFSAFFLLGTPSACGRHLLDS
jgi:hypothetical protein